MSVFEESVGCCGQASSPFIALGSLMGDEESWYRRAKAATTRYEQIMGSYQNLKPSSEKRAIADSIGNLEKPKRGTWHYSYRAVLYGVKKVDFEGTSIKHYYEEDRRQGRIVRLEEANDDFHAAVSDAYKETGQSQTDTGWKPLDKEDKEEGKLDLRTKPEGANMNWVGPVVFGGVALVAVGLIFALRK